MVVVWTFFHSSFLSSFSLSLGDGPTETEILSQKAVKPKTTNQPTDTMSIIIIKRNKNATFCSMENT